MSVFAGSVTILAQYRGAVFHVNPLKIKRNIVADCLIKETPHPVKRIMRGFYWLKLYIS